MASEVIELYQRLDDPELCVQPPKRPRRRRSNLALQDLPSEVVARILNFACNDPVDVVLVSLVCKEFQAMTSNEALWQRVCLNRFGFVSPDTVTRSGSWMTIMRNKALIENSPWTIKPKQPARVLQNAMLGTFHPFGTPSSCSTSTALSGAPPASRTLLTLVFNYCRSNLFGCYR